MQKRFQKIHVEISNICNLQCSFCPEVLRPKKLMDLELFTKIVREITPHTEQIAFHLMGDPLVHPNLSSLVEICSQYNLPINFVTNGVLLRDEKTSILLHKIFRQINFSLHSFNDNYPDKDPSSYLEKIFQFAEKAMQERPDLYINFRLWNLQEVRGQDAKNLEILKQIEDRFQVELPRQINLRQKKSFHIKARLYMHYDSEFIWPALNLPVLGDKGFCYGLTNHMGILVDGTLVPCCLDKEGLIPLGNINDRSFREILSSEKTFKILEGFKQRKLTEELCKRCNYISRFS